ncbi:unnamed protein product [Paramecium sonneborni]|uniref:Uncharacterized protein n=1 Tax=Paramecium sonneborni TaxID=65129 RepID=A0A8S1RN23_9CILI|nr:unnamed protein product [Paramecium sonneborni]
MNLIKNKFTNTIILIQFVMDLSIIIFLLVLKIKIEYQLKIK